MFITWWCDPKTPSHQYNWFRMDFYCCCAAAIVSELNNLIDHFHLTMLTNLLEKKWNHGRNKNYYQCSPKEERQAQTASWKCFEKRPHDNKRHKPTKWDSGQSALHRIQPSVQLVHHAGFLKSYITLTHKGIFTAWLEEYQSQKKILAMNNEISSSSVYYCNKNVLMFA